MILLTAFGVGGVVQAPQFLTASQDDHVWCLLLILESSSSWSDGGVKHRSRACGLLGKRNVGCVSCTIRMFVGALLCITTLSRAACRNCCTFLLVVTAATSSSPLGHTSLSVLSLLTSPRTPLYARCNRLVGYVRHVCLLLLAARSGSSTQPCSGRREKRAGSSRDVIITRVTSSSFV